MTRDKHDAIARINSTYRYAARVVEVKRFIFKKRAFSLLMNGVM